MSHTDDRREAHSHTHDHVAAPATADEIARALIQAEKLCQSKGKRFTDLRKHVYELILADGGTVKAYDLLDRLRPDRGSPKPPTVYRALEFLSKLGLIHRVEALNAYIACDHSMTGHVAEFFICECCSEVQERHADEHASCAPEGFVITRSVIEHYGRCEACAV